MCHDVFRRVDFLHVSATLDGGIHGESAIVRDQQRWSVLTDTRLRRPVRRETTVFGHLRGMAIGERLIPEDLVVAHFSRWHRPYPRRILRRT